MLNILQRVTILLFALVWGSNSMARENRGTDAYEALLRKVIVDADIVPVPGDSITITVKFNVPMDRDYSPVATLTIGDNVPQRFEQGNWSADSKTWVMNKERLGPVTGLGQLILDGARSSTGQLMVRHKENFLVGKEALRSKLAEIGDWMLHHRHEVIFVEGYDYRTFLALYEITGKQDYLDAARKGAEHLLEKQHPYGHWSTGYGSTYLADAGSALGAFINFYKYATPEEEKKIDNALQRYYDMMLVKGDGTGNPFVHKAGYLGVGFKDFKAGKVVEPMNNPYTISTSLSGAALFAASFYLYGEKRYKEISVHAVNWLLATQNEAGVYPYIIDDWDPKREHIWENYLYAASTYVGEGLIAACTYLNDPAMNKKIEKAQELHVGWLLSTQNEDGSWGEDKSFNSTRGHGVVNVLSWYYNHVKQDRRVAAAIRRYYLLLLDDNRRSYQEVARHPIGKWEWKVAGEYVSTALAGRALAEIIKPDVDCYRWKGLPPDSPTQ